MFHRKWLQVSTPDFTGQARLIFSSPRAVTISPQSSSKGRNRFPQPNENHSTTIASEDDIMITKIKIHLTCPCRNWRQARFHTAGILRELVPPRLQEYVR